MKYYVVDAFTEELFKGNPAGVCLVDEFPTDETMTNIAAENRLSKTAFVKHKVDGIYRVRFFTPTSEVDLCGHATLGTGFVLANFVERVRKNSICVPIKMILSLPFAKEDCMKLNSHPGIPKKLQ